MGANLDGTRHAKTEIIKAVLDSTSSTSKKKIVMIGDRYHDIIGAKNNSIDCIGVTYGYGSREELQEAEATLIVDSVEKFGKVLQESNKY